MTAIRFFRRSLSCTALLAGLCVATVPARSAAPLINTSARSVLTPQNPTAIVGFVLGGDATQERSRWVLVRALGPSLARFGIPQPVTEPTAMLFGGNDGPTRLGYSNRVFPLVVYADGTTPESRFYDAMRRATALVGAAPVPIPAADEPIPEEHDLVDLVELPPGAYTIQAHAPQQSGVVLVETFLLPVDFDPQLSPED